MILEPAFAYFVFLPQAAQAARLLQKSRKMWTHALLRLLQTEII